MRARGNTAMRTMLRTYVRPRKVAPTPAPKRADLEFYEKDNGTEVLQMWTACPKCGYRYYTSTAPKTCVMCRTDAPIPGGKF